MTRYILSILPILIPIQLVNGTASTTEVSGYEELVRSVDTYNVTATIYYPTGNPTASGSRIKKDYKMETHRWCALSRDLLARWGGEFEYGDTIVVSGIRDDVDGIFIVHDTMNKRYKRRIDLLVRRANPLFNKWDNVTIRKYDSTREDYL
jgi:3D (Asp-Asp-Asp) domain-containing protein